MRDVSQVFFEFCECTEDLWFIPVVCAPKMAFKELLRNALCLTEVASTVRHPNDIEFEVNGAWITLLGSVQLLTSGTVGKRVLFCFVFLCFVLLSHVRWIFVLLDGWWWWLVVLARRRFGEWLARGVVHVRVLCLSFLDFASAPLSLRICFLWLRCHLVYAAVQLNFGSQYYTLSQQIQSCSSAIYVIFSNCMKSKHQTC